MFLHPQKLYFLGEPNYPSRPEVPRLYFFSPEYSRKFVELGEAVIMPNFFKNKKKVVGAVLGATLPVG